MPILERVVEDIALKDQKHGRKLHKYLKQQNGLFFEQAERFLVGMERYLAQTNKTLEDATEAYLRMRTDMQGLYEDFVENERYLHTSFAEVNAANYQQPEVMEYHMLGLTLAQFLWPDQYERFRFFAASLASTGLKAGRYLEIGAGHGLYLAEAVRLLGEKWHYDVVDISPTSLDMAKAQVQHPAVHYQLADVFEMHPARGYDLIVMGELIEHLEDPLAMLKKAESLLAEGGQIYLTTPANAPMIDHIYLFRNADEIRELCREANLKVLTESIMYTDNLPQEVAERFKLPMMYAAFLGN
ncbi:MAG: class I SAM-dependent methyltransferase [Bacteroidota bacterium]